jgi:hypothetical protein
MGIVDFDVMTEIVFDDAESFARSGGSKVRPSIVCYIFFRAATKVFWMMECQSRAVIKNHNPARPCPQGKCEQAISMKFAGNQVRDVGAQRLEVAMRRRGDDTRG